MSKKEEKDVAGNRGWSDERKGLDPRNASNPKDAKGNERDSSFRAFRSNLAY